MRVETIEVRQNLSLVMRERGKIVGRREGHNIWLNLGREYLAQLIAYGDFTPLTTLRDDRIRYMGLGIGGTRQLAVGVANNPPFSVAYPGPNTQTDMDLQVTQLERPVRISGSEDAYPGQGSDVWLAQVQAPPDHPLPYQTKFSRVFTSLQVNYGSFLNVPLSEIGLFTNNANPNVYNNTIVAYDTFDTLTKTSSFELQIDWTIRF